MTDTIGEHDLGPSKLVLGGVDLLAKKLIEGGEAGEDEGSSLHLDDTLPKTDEVGSDADTASGGVTEGEDLIVGTGGLTSDLSGSLEILHANAVFGTDDIIHSPSLLDLVGIDGALGEFLIVSISEVEVVQSLGRVLRVSELDVELSFELLHQSNAGSGITGDVDAGDFLLASIFTGFVEKIVLLHSKTSALDGDIVRDKDNFSSARVFWCLHRDFPCQHTNLVGTNITSSGGEHSILSQQQFLTAEKVGGNIRTAVSGKILEMGVPLVDNSDLEQTEEIIGVGGADAPRQRPLDRDHIEDAVGVDGAELLVVSDGAELTSLSRDRVGSLNISLGLEPLPSHGGGDEPDRHDPIFPSAGTHLDLDLVHSQLEQTRRETGLNFLHDVAKVLSQFLGGGVDLRHGMEEDAGGGGVGDARISKGILELVEARGQGAGGAGEGGQVHGVREGPDEDVFGGVADGARGDLSAQVDLSVLAQGLEALEFVVDGEAGYLQDVVPGGAHVSAEWILGKILAFGEGVVQGVLLGNGHDHADGASLDSSQTGYVGL
mmetsp:Transcript_31792/g.73025  ORF Transcript_31792/g.73025 Transcript_31792/m.73025 type:complete len:546 (-) Transcript_31792:2653-4290(-)